MSPPRRYHVAVFNERRHRFIRLNALWLKVEARVQTKK